MARRRRTPGCSQRARRAADPDVRRHTAAEILRVISSSPSDVQPVFDAITESAARLCGVTDGWIVLTEGDTLRGVSALGQLVGPLPFTTRVAYKGPSRCKQVELLSIVRPAKSADHPALAAAACG